MKKQLETEIEINAPAERVWKVLTDFHAHPIWNPFIKELRGKPVEGEKLRVFIQPPGGKGMVFKPTVLKAEENRELRWLGKLFVSGLFDGEHYFLIEPLDENRVRFVHGENFSGLLVRLFAKGLDTGTLAGFREMNEALKSRAEGFK
ncbi:MAG TPA: SRPBCC domain-containing protein [Pyrinomonadaceae bacterium]|nr:SRPBCC domain-containing protein [Pyrinomonadaceae bacterium]